MVGRVILVYFKKTFRGYAGLPPITGLSLRFLRPGVELTDFIDHLVTSIFIRCQHLEKTVTSGSSFSRKNPYRLMEEIPAHNRRNPNTAVINP